MGTAMTGTGVVVERHGQGQGEERGQEQEQKQEQEQEQEQEEQVIAVDKWDEDDPSDQPPVATQDPYSEEAWGWGEQLRENKKVKEDVQGIQEYMWYRWYKGYRGNMMYRRRLIQYQQYYTHLYLVRE
jgi:hypothetical protein